MYPEHPSVIAGFQIERTVGAGGMGTVYAARHPRLPRTIALKVLNPAFASDTMYRSRFQREGQLAASLDHPNIVPIYDCGEDDGRLWLSMRLVAGTNAASCSAPTPVASTRRRWYRSASMSPPHSTSPTSAACCTGT